MTSGARDARAGEEFLQGGEGVGDGVQIGQAMLRYATIKLARRKPTHRPHPHPHPHRQLLYPHNIEHEGWGTQDPPPPLPKKKQDETQ